MFKLLTNRKKEVQKLESFEDPLQFLRIRIDELKKRAKVMHRRNDYYWDHQAGCNVGGHLMRAALSMDSFVSSVPVSERPDYIARLSIAIVESRTAFLRDHHDPDWFGVGVHNEVLLALLQECDRLGVHRPVADHTLSP